MHSLTLVGQGNLNDFLFDKIGVMGGRGADIDIQTSVSGMKHVIDELTPAKSGKFLSYDGSEMPW